MSRRPSVWTEARDTELRAYVTAGLTSPEIAPKMGMTSIAVKARRTALGIVAPAAATDDAIADAIRAGGSNNSIRLALHTDRARVAAVRAAIGVANLTHAEGRKFRSDPVRKAKVVPVAVPETTPELPPERFMGKRPDGSYIFARADKVPADADAQIAAWLATHQPTKCPAVPLAPTTAEISAEDRAAIVARNAAFAAESEIGMKKRDCRSWLQKRLAAERRVA